MPRRVIGKGFESSRRDLLILLYNTSIEESIAPCFVFTLNVLLYFHNTFMNTNLTRVNLKLHNSCLLLFLL